MIRLHPDLESSCLGDVFDAFERLVLLAVHVQPAHLQAGYDVLKKNARITDCSNWHLHDKALE